MQNLRANRRTSAPPVSRHRIGPIAGLLGLLALASCAGAADRHEPAPSLGAASQAEVRSAVTRADEVPAWIRSWYAASQGGGFCWGPRFPPGGHSETDGKFTPPDHRAGTEPNSTFRARGSAYDGFDWGALVERHYRILAELYPESDWSGPTERALWEGIQGLEPRLEGTCVWETCPCEL